MPGTKPSEPKPKPPKPRRPRPQAFVRPRGIATETVDHDPATCPACQTALAGGWLQRTHEVLDLPESPLRVIAHRLYARQCPVCPRRVVAKPGLRGVVVGRQRLSTRLVSFVAIMQTELRLPVRQIRALLRTVYGLALSQGAIVACARQVAEAGAGLVAQLSAVVRASPVVHADETGCSAVPREASRASPARSRRHSSRWVTAWRASRAG